MAHIGAMVLTCCAGHRAGPQGQGFPAVPHTATHHILELWIRHLFWEFAQAAISSLCPDEGLWGCRAGLELAGAVGARGWTRAD